MGAHFHRDVHSRLTVKAFEKGFRRGHHPFLQYDLSPFVQDADATLLVAQIDSYISAGLPGRLFDILAHKLVSLIAPLGNALSTTGSSLLHAASGDQSSHSIFQAAQLHQATRFAGGV